MCCKGHAFIQKALPIKWHILLVATIFPLMTQTCVYAWVCVCVFCIFYFESSHQCKCELFHSLQHRHGRCANVKVVETTDLPSTKHVKLQIHFFNNKMKWCVLNWHIVRIFLNLLRFSDPCMRQRINHHCRWWLVAWLAPSHYMNKC